MLLRSDLKPKPRSTRLNGEGFVEQVAVTRSHAGEADFDALVGPHLEAGYRVALAILRDPDEAHDAVQEAAFKAWRRIRQLNEAASARAWVPRHRRQPVPEHAAH